VARGLRAEDHRLGLCDDEITVRLDGYVHVEELEVGGWSAASAGDAIERALRSASMRKVALWTTLPFIFDLLFAATAAARL